MLETVSSKCLYLDEIIDVKILKRDQEVEDEEENLRPTQAVLCSNNETVKLMDLETGQVRQFGGHSDIILCLDVSRNLVLSGSKDNTIRLWRYEEQSQELNCLASFQGHNENIASVCFAPKKVNFFVSASQDNSIKIWDI